MIKIGKLELNNPVILASGTCGWGKELKDLIDLSRLGAIVTKSVSKQPMQGNKTPRIAETPSGVLNSIGLENPGIDSFLSDILPEVTSYKVPIIISIWAQTIDDFVYLAKILNEQGVDAIELNLSCPNIHLKGYSLLSQDEKAVGEVIKKTRGVFEGTLFAKLTPEVTNIVPIAKTAKASGADALVLSNTIRALSIDIEKKRPKLANVIGGLSGPAIRPVILRIVWEVYNEVDIPIIGAGGITTASDAIEYILAGAKAVQIGTANLVDPRISLEVIDGLELYVKSQDADSIEELVGKAHEL